MPCLPWPREEIIWDQVLGSLAERVVDLLADTLGGCEADHRSERDTWLARITELVSLGDSDELVDKLVKDRGVDVDALHRAARLTRVEHGTVDQLFSCPLDIGVRTHVCRVLAAQFETDALEARSIRRSLGERLATGDGAGEDEEANASVCG